jgi:hypothetical protein
MSHKEPQLINFDQTSIEMITHQLKREIKDLREKNESLSIANEKLSNSEFTSKLLHEEKKALERELSAKNEHNLKVVSQLRSEVDLLTKKISEEETKNKLISHEFEQLEADFGRASDEKAKLNEVLANLEGNFNDLSLDSKKYGY